MQEWVAVVSIQQSNYNLDALKDEAVKSRWGSYKNLESEVKSFIHKVHDFGEKIVQIAVVAEEYLYERAPARQPPLQLMRCCRYFIILNRIWPMLNSQEDLSKDLFRVRSPCAPPSPPPVAFAFASLPPPPLPPPSARSARPTNRTRTGRARSAYTSCSCSSGFSGRKLQEL